MNSKNIKLYNICQKIVQKEKKTQMISHGRKAISIFKWCWNTQGNENEPVKCIDLERDVKEFKILHEPNLTSVVGNSTDSMQPLEINVSEVTQFHQKRN